MTRGDRSPPSPMGVKDWLRSPWRSALAPKVLLLDEPAAGVPSGESGRIVAAIESLPPDIAVLIIDHDMDLVFRLARQITVLVRGSVLAEGPPAAIGADPRVRQVYLGERVPR